MSQNGEEVRYKKIAFAKDANIDTPFKMCAVDLIRPIHPASEKGHGYILTLVNYAKRYPEAIPLKEFLEVSLKQCWIFIAQWVSLRS